MWVEAVIDFPSRPRTQRADDSFPKKRADISGHSYTVPDIFTLRMNRVVRAFLDMGIWAHLPSIAFGCAVGHP